MFIVSKKNFKFTIKGGDNYLLAKDYMGNVPDSLAEHPLFQAAVKGGDIMVPETTSDKAIYKADAEAETRRLEGDIRPDAVKPDKTTAEAPKAAGKGAEKPRRAKK